MPPKNFKRIPSTYHDANSKSVMGRYFGYNPLRGRDSPEDWNEKGFSFQRLKVMDSSDMRLALDSRFRGNDVERPGVTHNGRYLCPAFRPARESQQIEKIFLIDIGPLEKLLQSSRVNLVSGVEGE